MSKTSVLLRIDSSFKSTVQNLYVVSAQVAGYGHSLDLDRSTSIKDGEAVFRIAKEYALDHAFDEIQVVELEDILRMLRFICWMISGHDKAGANSSSSERAGLLRQLLASVVLQTQAQQHSFESLLKTFGIARELETQLNESTGQSTGRSASQSTARSADQTSESIAEREVALKLQRTDRVHQTKIRISAEGVEMTSTVAERTWTAHATRKIPTQKTPKR